MKKTLFLICTCSLFASCDRPTKKYTLLSSPHSTSHKLYKINIETGETWRLDDGAIQNPSNPQDEIGFEGWTKINEIEKAQQDAEKSIQKAQKK